MKLIVGLGNPGKKYEKTWHNIGFLVLDKLVQNLNDEKFKADKKLLAEIAIAKLGKEKIILAKPETFMNNSGNSVSAIMKFYKIDLEDIIIIHDDIDLPLGKLRITLNSSAGGHNGIKSIIDIIKSKDFARIKIGVATDRLGLMDSADYVLEKIHKTNSKKVNEIIKKATEAVVCIIEKSPQVAMNLYN